MLVTAICCNGQKMAEDYYYHHGAAKYQDNGNLKEAAFQDLKYLVEHHPRSKYCINAYYAIGGYYEEKGDDYKAINAYRAILDRFEKYLDKDSTLSASSSIPNATNKLVDLYEKIGKYDSAIYFLYVYDTVLHLFYGCGTGLEYEQAARSGRISDLYEKNNQVSQAKKVLLAGYVFNGEWSDPVILEHIIGRLKNLFKKHDDPAQLKAEIEISVNNYYFDTVYRDISGADTFVLCNINFAGVEIRHYYKAYLSDGTIIDDIQTGREMPDREAIIAYLKKSELYKMVQEL